MSWNDDKFNQEDENQQYEKVPYGTYEVAVIKLETTTSKSSGKDMVTCWFKILTGDHKDRIIFMNQVVEKAFQRKILDEVLKKLVDDLPIAIKYENPRELYVLIMDIFEAISGKLEYALEFNKDGKFDSFRISQVFDAS